MWKHFKQKYFKTHRAIGQWIVYEMYLANDKENQSIQRNNTRMSQKYRIFCFDLIRVRDKETSKTWISFKFLRKFDNRQFRNNPVYVNYFFLKYFQVEYIGWNNSTLVKKVLFKWVWILNYRTQSWVSRAYFMSIGPPPPILYKLFCIYDNIKTGYGNIRIMHNQRRLKLIGNLTVLLNECLDTSVVWK